MSNVIPSPKEPVLPKRTPDLIVVGGTTTAPDVIRIRKSVADAIERGKQNTKKTKTPSPQPQNRRLTYDTLETTVGDSSYIEPVLRGTIAARGADPDDITHGTIADERFSAF